MLYFISLNGQMFDFDNNSEKAIKIYNEGVLALNDEIDYDKVILTNQHLFSYLLK